MKKMKRTMFPVVIVAFLCVCLLLTGCFRTTAANEDMWGRAEAKEVDVLSKIPGRVVELLVKEGDLVKKGQVIARIDSRDLVAQARQSTASIDALRAQTKQASAVTTLQDQTARATLANANAQLNKLKTELELTEKDYIRFSELVESGAVSRQTFDACQTKYEAAQAAYQQGQASVAAAQAGLLQTQVNLENEAALQGKVEQAQAGLQQVEVALDETEIRAPFDGIVTTKYVEVGAMVSQGTPLVTVQDPTDNWINLKIREDEISQYALQQKVQLQAHDPAIKIDGVIVDISKKAEFATYRATNERGDTDVVTFNVKIQVDSEQVRPGMRFKLLGGDA